MIYDVTSHLFRSFLSQKGGAFEKRKTEEQKPTNQIPKARENKPMMIE
ncbi:Wound-induced basic protein [Bienertia sinuspersici]